MQCAPHTKNVHAVIRKQKRAATTRGAETTSVNGTTSAYYRNAPGLVQKFMEPVCPADPQSFSPEAYPFKWIAASTI